MANSPVVLPWVVQRYVDTFNEGDFETLLRLFTPDAQIFGVLGSASIAQAEPIWRELHAGMAMQLNPEAVVFDGSSTVVRFLETGTFRGNFRGLSGFKPTYLPYQVRAMEWFELEGNLIARRWGARDFDSIKSQVLGT
jgi:hypothetical protein